MCYRSSLSKANYKVSVGSICQGGTRMKTKKRKMVMYQFGGTIGASRYPLFLKNETDLKGHSSNFSMLPRPVVKSRPGEYGHTIMNHTPWLKKLVGDISAVVQKFLFQLNSGNSENCIQVIEKTLQIVPPCLRISNSFFTQMIILRDEKLKKENDIPVHIDEDDYINAILTLGDISNDGGSTVYYTGVHQNDTGKICYSVPFEHGRLQIGFFDQVYHGVSGWEGDRVCTL